MDTADAGLRCSESSGNAEALVSGSYMLVPHGFAAGNQIQIWVGVHDALSTGRLWLRSEPLVPQSAEIPSCVSSCRDAPLQLERQAQGLRYTLVTMPAAPGCYYRLSLWQWQNGEQSKLAEADCRGRPDSLASGFNVWYGTCFYRNADHGALAEAFSALPVAARPDVSFLGGDQVYLDTAFSNTGFTFIPGFSTRNFSPLALRSDGSIRRLLNKIFAREYRETWRGGLRKLLRSGSHYFLAGDHEFWNDYPNPPGFLPVLWSSRVRRIWDDCARQLFNAYQLPHGRGASQFDVGKELSFFVLDTRLQRGRGRDRNVTDPATLQQLEDWLQGLESPGVLVLPAPLLTRWQFRAGGIGRALQVALGFGDHSLADTGQYQALVRALNACRQDVLILAGDVHFSRLAEFELNGKQVVEVVSSPLSCLPSAAAVPEQKPGFFPDRPTDDIRVKVNYLKAGSTRSVLRATSGNELGKSISNNNFVTLGFTRGDKGICVNIQCWNVNARNECGTPAVDWESRQILLHRRQPEIRRDTDATEAQASE
ncbi:hypothetical protein [Microbulbifer sp. YPW1]|uniref:hypothetical protein n=1 Tax=Microbulbifer sp. YPW1 TaxID=2745199 RepID=UPI0015974100|nr:hypothetical protein [Microbulbifer sp. YPW1]QKX17701.1 hypothetical protein HUW35_12305 [Microbulbifer sp. YPW1]